MKLTEANRAQFETMLDGLATDVVDAGIHFKLHYDLRKSVASYAREMNQARAFWSLTINAHLDACRARIFRAYDTHTAALSLPTLLATIGANLETFEKDASSARPVSVDRAELKENRRSVSAEDPLVKKLIQQRHKLFAHRDARNVLEKLGIEDDSALTYEEIQALLSRALSILNCYSQFLRRRTWSSQIVGHDDYRSVLGAVRDAVRMHEERIEAEIRAATGGHSEGSLM